MVSLAYMRRCLSGFHPRPSSISDTLERFLYLPVTKRAALLCTMSRRAISCFSWGSHTVLAYSRMGLTREVYANDFIFCMLILRFLRRNPSVLFALVHMLLICDFQVMSLEIQHPRQAAQFVYVYPCYHSGVL